MARLRDDIIEWAAKGRLRPEDVPRALEIAEPPPPVSDWRKFLQALLLWIGTLLSASGVIFFFAYNWKNFPRVGKFALAEILLAAAVAAAWFDRRRQRGPAGRRDNLTRPAARVDLPSSIDRVDIGWLANQ